MLCQALKGCTDVIIILSVYLDPSQQLELTELNILEQQQTLFYLDFSKLFQQECTKHVENCMRND